MPFAGEMQTLAQIAIGIAGFSGILVGLRPEVTLNRTSADYVRVREIVLNSFGVFFFAFLPSLAVGAFGDSRWAWQAPQICFAIYHLAIIALFLRAGVPNALIPFEHVIAPVGMVVLALQIATGLGFLSAYLEETYYLALLWSLFVAATRFAVLLLRRGAR
jgi:hypothetical protein